MREPSGYFLLFAVSAVVMCISHTVSRERICAPIRDCLGGKDTWFGYLVSCPYCFSHWVAFVLVPLTGAWYVRIPWRWGFVATAIDLVLSSLLVVIVAAFMRVAFWFVDETQGLVKREQRLVEEQAQRIAEGEEPPAMH